MDEKWKIKKKKQKNLIGSNWCQTYLLGSKKIEIEIKKEA
jgi:hypothetical protein